MEENNDEKCQVEDVGKNKSECTDNHVVKDDTNCSEQNQSEETIYKNQQENRTESLLLNRIKRIQRSSSRRGLIVLVILVILALLGTSYALKKLVVFNRTKSPVKVIPITEIREYVDISIEDVKNILQLAVIECPFSEFDVIEIKGGLGTKTEVLYIVRGQIKLGIDIADFKEEDFFIDNEKKTIFVFLPEIRVLSNEIDYKSSERELVVESRLIDTTKALESEDEIYIRQQQKAEKNVLLEYLNAAKSETIRQVKGYLELLQDGYKIEVSFHEN